MLRFYKLKYLSYFFIILLFGLQVIPKQESVNLRNSTLPESTVNTEFTALTAINFQYQQIVNKSLQNISLSPVNLVCDRFDIIPGQVSTDAKEIYGGSFSYLNRYSNFLTALFATST